MRKNTLLEVNVRHIILYCKAAYVSSNANDLDSYKLKLDRFRETMNDLRL